ncbi:MAG: ABC transporter ATP-binding protein [Prosthecobacter sp.]|uniref:ABC transporter ATP-binding protein n=1 Tax=Prosthecobacter sp. TaxID=1965333 RepID=UPI003BB05A78
MKFLLGKLLKKTNPASLAALKKLLSYARTQWRRLATGLVLSIGSGMFNAFMLLSFNVIFSIVLKGDSPVLEKSLPVPFVGMVSLREALHLPLKGEKASFYSVVLASALIPCMIFCRGFLGYLATRSYVKASSHILFRIRNDLYAAILRQSMVFFNRSKAGELIQVVSLQSTALQVNALALVQAITRHPAMILSTLSVIFTIDPLFTFMSLFVFPLCIIPVRMISRAVKSSGQTEFNASSDMLVSMHEAFGGIRLVKGNSREDYELARFEKGNRASSIDAIRFNKLTDLSGTVVETVASLGIAAGLIYWWHLDKSAADFMFLVVALIGMYPPIKELSRVGMTTERTLSACQEVFKLLEREPDIKDRPDALALPRTTGSISLRNVTFTYVKPDGEKYDRPAVRNVSLDIEPGKFYALVGPSGSGKSTLFSLFLRYYDVDDGVISIDGHDIRDVTQKTLRENIGIVSQDVFLFHDTIRQNIRYGRLEATDEEILHAATQAHVDSFVQEFQEGYDTVVGDGGSKISGGQKQRISIARTILKNAPVLLLDEATSALDTESERIIQEAIHDLTAGRTVIAIAHRLSTVLAAHKIIVMQEGRVEAIGSNEELLRSSSLYRRLYELQFNTSPDATLDASMA